MTIVINNMDKELLKATLDHTIINAVNPEDSNE